MSATDWLLLLVLSVLWGGSFYFAKITVLEIPPLTLALGRVAIAAAALAMFARAIGEPFPRGAAAWSRLAFCGLYQGPAKRFHHGLGSWLARLRSCAREPVLCILTLLLPPLL